MPSDIVWVGTIVLIGLLIWVIKWKVSKYCRVLIDVYKLIRLLFQHNKHHYHFIANSYSNLATIRSTTDDGIWKTSCTKLFGIAHDIATMHNNFIDHCITNHLSLSIINSKTGECILGNENISRYSTVMINSLLKYRGDIFVVVDFPNEPRKVLAGAGRVVYREIVELAISAHYANNILWVSARVCSDEVPPTSTKEDVKGD